MKLIDKIIYSVGFANTVLMLFIYSMIKIKGSVCFTEPNELIIAFEVLMSVIFVFLFILRAIQKMR